MLISDQNNVLLPEHFITRKEQTQMFVK